MDGRPASTLFKAEWSPDNFRNWPRGFPAGKKRRNLSSWVLFSLGWAQPPISLLKKESSGLLNGKNAANNVLPRLPW